MPLPHTNISVVNPGGGATPLPHKNIRKNLEKKVEDRPFVALWGSGAVRHNSHEVVAFRTVPSSPYGAQGRFGLHFHEVGGRRWRSAVDFTFIKIARDKAYSDETCTNRSEIVSGVR